MGIDAYLVKIEEGEATEIPCCVRYFGFSYEFGLIGSRWPDLSRLIKPQLQSGAELKYWPDYAGRLDADNYEFEWSDFYRHRHAWKHRRQIWAGHIDVEKHYQIGDV